MNTEKALQDEALLKAYQAAFDEGYDVAEAELLPVIEDLEAEIHSLRQQIYIMGGTYGR